MEVSTNGATKLDLAGHVITLTGVADHDFGGRIVPLTAPAIYLPEGADLTVVDSVGGGLLDTYSRTETSGAPAVRDAIIGSRFNDSGTGDLTIDGAEVHATVTDDSGAAAVGGGTNVDGGNVTVLSGRLVVDAWKGSSSAGIGGGGSVVRTGGTLTVNGGEVVAYGSSRGAAIGGGGQGEGADVVVNGGSVTATAGTSFGDAIGNGKITSSEAYPADGGTLTVNGGIVNATAEAFGAAIGSDDVVISPSREAWSTPPRARRGRLEAGKIAPLAQSRFMVARSMRQAPPE